MIIALLFSIVPIGYPVQVQLLSESGMFVSPTEGYVIGCDYTYRPLTDGTFEVTFWNNDGTSFWICPDFYGVTFVPLGDCDGNGSVDFFDIDPFVVLLTGGDSGTIDPMVGDCNGDGVVDFFDIDPFVVILCQ